MTEAVETGACLWMVTKNHIFGIRLENLESLGNKDVRDRKSIRVPPPVDFHLKFPDPDLRPFVFHSNLFFAGGSPHSSTKIHQLSYAGGTTLDIAETAAAGPIPPPPTLLYDCYVESIQGDVYLMVHDWKMDTRDMGFWVLRSGSGSKQWHPLPLPPSLLNSDYDSESDSDLNFVRFRWWRCFVWKDKLVLEVEADHTEESYSRNNMFIFYVYDPRIGCWEQLKSPFYTSFPKYDPACVAVKSIGEVGNCSVAITWSRERLPSEYFLEVKVKIHALLVDDEHSIHGQQCLDEVCEAIPSPFDATELDAKFVDLGNSKVCAVIGSVTNGNPVLCVRGTSLNCPVPPFFSHSPKEVPDNEFEKRIRPEVIPANEIGVTFSDIGSLDEIKESLQELVMLPLRRPDLFKGGLLKPCRGILLFGPPGTGKTMLAKAIANEAGASFINVSMSTITSKWFGEDEKNVRALFTLAAKVAPTIIFVDEVDSMLGQRTRVGEHEAMRKIKNDFMTHWDGLLTRPDEQILVLAATNRPFDLDEAIIRRFERRLWLVFHLLRTGKRF
ncbi:hypothetical protein PIB30_064252 [Stylosanthes scabra]|uniref:AAA+ ATPase domain-containing protein n=1 Tax=Stylosanthes scabra TaxID=79078 RepID=A0ABU6VLF5_9FABA|nr:hypothetical protein [Stylosanthes scabra]